MTIRANRSRAVRFFLPDAFKISRFFVSGLSIGSRALMQKQQAVVLHNLRPALRHRPGASARPVSAQCGQSPNQGYGGGFYQGFGTASISIISPSTRTRTNPWLLSFLSLSCWLPFWCSTSGAKKVCSACLAQGQNVGNYLSAARAAMRRPHLGQYRLPRRA